MPRIPSCSRKLIHFIRLIPKNLSIAESDHATTAGMISRATRLGDETRLKSANIGGWDHGTELDLNSRACLADGLLGFRPPAPAPRESCPREPGISAGALVCLRGRHGQPRLEPAAGMHRPNRAGRRTRSAGGDHLLEPDQARGCSGRARQSEEVGCSSAGSGGTGNFTFSDSSPIRGPKRPRARSRSTPEAASRP
jgi:hypothetical protein